MLGEIIDDKDPKNTCSSSSKIKHKSYNSVEESNDSQPLSTKSKENEKASKKKIKTTKCSNCKSLKQKITELEQIVIDLNKIKDSLTKEKDELFSKNKELSQKNIELTSLNEQLEKVNKDLEKDNSELKNENNQLKKQLDTKINDIKLLTSESFRQENNMKTEEELKNNSNGETSLENDKDNKKNINNNTNTKSCNCQKIIDDLLNRLKLIEDWKNNQEKKENSNVNKFKDLENKIIKNENSLLKLRDEFNEFTYNSDNKYKNLPKKISSKYSEQKKDENGNDDSENEKDDYPKKKTRNNDYYDKNTNPNSNTTKRKYKKIYPLKESDNNSETEKLAKSQDNLDNIDNNNYLNKINRRYLKNKQFSDKKIQQIRAKTPLNLPSTSNSNNKNREKPKRIKSVFNSKIISDTDDLDLIARGLVMDNIKKLRNLKIGYKLIYRATEDGDTAKNFHENCDGIFGTLTIIKTRGGWVFGGYTTTSWDSDEQNEKKDLDSFVFSVNLEKIYYATEKEDYSIYCDKNKGPCFIGMFSIEKNILDMKSFISPWNVQCYEGETLTGEINGGKMDFYVEELEVFQVIIKKTRD